MDNLKKELAPHKGKWPFDPCIFGTLSKESRDILSQALEVFELFPWKSSMDMFTKNIMAYVKLTHMLNEQGFPPELYVKFLVEEGARVANFFSSKRNQFKFVKWAKAHTDLLVLRSDKLNYLRSMCGEDLVDRKLIEEYGKDRQKYIPRWEEEIVSDSDWLSGIFLAVHLHPDYSGLPDDVTEKIEKTLKLLDRESVRAKLYVLAKESGYVEICEFLDGRYVQKAVAS